MYNHPKSTIAQILFADFSELSFAHVVGELDKSLNGASGQDHSLTWDCDDIAIFDMTGTRIVLSLADLTRIPNSTRAYRACLTISVGSAPGLHTITPLSRRHEGLCSVIADRVRSFYTAEAILWQELPHCMTPELIDALVDDLPRPANQNAGPHVEVTHPVPQARTAAPIQVMPQDAAPPRHPPIVVTPPDAPFTAANSQPDLPRTDHSRLNRVREALYTPTQDDAENAPPSAQIRLAAHAVNATLVVVYLPLGAALMTYSLIRGGDMRMSSQAIALTGLFLAIAHSQFATQISSLI
ncbi:MAG: hypothetical protein U1D35_11465 [Paracoccaceae bacterium]|nr:hypothetical protein [Paracoccaceae bacterium]